MLYLYRIRIPYFLEQEGKDFLRISIVSTPASRENVIQRLENYRGLHEKKLEKHLRMQKDYRYIKAVLRSGYCRIL